MTASLASRTLIECTKFATVGSRASPKSSGRQRGSGLVRSTTGHEIAVSDAGRATPLLNREGHQASLSVARARPKGSARTFWI